MEYHKTKYFLANANVVYDPELELYVIMDEDGYTADMPYNTRKEAEEALAEMV